MAATGGEPGHGGDGRGRRSDSRGGGTGGIPDGLLLGLLGFLLTATVLVWAGTGLSGLFAHGSWPRGIPFTHTPVAMRHLVTDPADLATAWPDADGQLSGPGLFWGILIGQLMVLTVLGIWAVGTAARWRAVRKARREAGGPLAARTAPAPESVPAQTPSASAYGAPSDGRGASVERDGAREGRARAGGAGPAPDRMEMTKPAAPAAGDTLTAAAAAAGGRHLPHSTPPDSTADSNAADGGAADGGAADGGAADGSTVSGPSSPAGRPAGITGTSWGLHFTGPGGARDRRPLALTAIADATGPLLVVTSDPTLWADTKDARAKLGPVHLYDPEHLLDTPARLRWSPTAGCETREVAAARAAAFLAPVRPLHAQDSAIADAAETLLRCWLHAAALDSRGGTAARRLHRWASGGSAHEPVRILRTNAKAAPGSAGELEATLTAHPERREMAQELTSRALSALSSIHIRDACNPTRADSLALESFVIEGGTLYVTGEAIEDPRVRPGAMPFVTALVESVVEHGRRMAERSPAGRLDPPLTLVLDDIAAVAPVPALPELLATGADRGLPALALLRSREQARARWPRHAFATD